MRGARTTDVNIQWQMIKTQIPTYVMRTPRVLPSSQQQVSKRRPHEEMRHRRRRGREITEIIKMLIKKGMGLHRPAK